MLFSYLRRSMFMSAGLTSVLLISACQTNTESNNKTNAATPNVEPGFYAYYTRLNSDADWEAHQFVGEYADIVVNLSESQQLKFWRGSSYLPLWQTDQGQSFMPQLFETSGDGEGLRWDKLNRHSHVRIIEQSDTEVVVHWRYAPTFDTDENPLIPGWTGWVDEYYTITIDGLVTREVYDHDDAKKITSTLRLNANGTIENLDQVSSDYTSTAPAYNSTDELPTGDNAGFGAQYTKLGYSGAWDIGPEDEYQPNSPDWNENWQVQDHPDVVVNFDNNKTKWVFWRGLSYVPSMVSENGAWFTNEFNESWEWPQMCEDGGAEPMNDKQARYSHVRIIENTPARAVVHWRYHLTGICYNLIDTEDTPDGWGAVSDFVFYIYPDGSTLSKNTLHSQQVNTYGDTINGFEYHEAIVVNSAGKAPWDNIETQETLSILNLAGEVSSYDGKNGAINNSGDEPFPLPIKGNITRINLKNTDFDTYTIMERGETLEIMPYWEMDFDNEYPDHDFVRWDHWPVNQIRAFGRGTNNAEYPSHTSLFHMAFNPPFAQADTSQTRLLLTGVSDADNNQIVNLANAWLNAPNIQDISGAADVYYDKSQRAYQLKASADEINFTLSGTDKQPIYNPAFIIEDWKGSEAIQITINGHPLPELKQGIIRNHKGKRSLLLFVPWQSTSQLHVQIRSN